MDQRYEAVRHAVNRDFIMTEQTVLTYISRLRLGCAAGIDGVSAEHLKWSRNTRVIPVLCQMLTLCVRFGIVGDSFTKGLLIPLLKKPNIDPSIPKNYRPIVISTTFSKILEIHILAMCGEHEFHDLQFGFIASRSTTMAAALTHDIIDYCVANGSPVYVCALDAEGAFDNIPHGVMFAKAIDVVPTLYWRILIDWYRRLTVVIRWAGTESMPLDIRKGTRQGGLSSPYIFNLLYEGLIAELSEMNCGVRVNTSSYNVCCYADDLLLMSLTVTGLQKQIDASDKYITKHGLRFNPKKTTCVTFGKSTVAPRSWSLQQIQLAESKEVKHLGVILSKDCRSHVTDRTQSARRAFYCLQGAGLCQRGCSPGTISHIYSAAVWPVLTYGLECLYHDKTSVKSLESLQGKLLKSALGLKRSCRTKPLLQALNIDSILTTVENQKLSLFKSLLLSKSRSRVFYLHLLSLQINGSYVNSKNLVSSVISICKKYHISLLQYIIDEKYQLYCKRVVKSRAQSGLSDSVKYSLLSRNLDMSNALLASF